MDFARGITTTKLNDARQGPARRRRAPRSGSSPTARSSPSWRSTTRRIAIRLRELSFLNKGVTITLKDERAGDGEDRDLPRQGRAQGDGAVPQSATGSRCTRRSCTSRPTKDDIGIELALQYNDGYNENVFSFVNNINTHEGGTHLTGFKAALTRTINNYATQGQLPQEGRLHADAATTCARG